MAYQPVARSTAANVEKVVPRVTASTTASRSTAPLWSVSAALMLTSAASPPEAPIAAQAHKRPRSCGLSRKADRPSALRLELPFSPLHDVTWLRKPDP